MKYLLIILVSLVVFSCKKELVQVVEKIEVHDPCAPRLLFSPAPFMNPFMASPCEIIRPTFSDNIEWDIIDYAIDHSKSFFDSAYGNNDDYFNCTPDCFAGTSAGVTNLSLPNKIK